MRLIGYARVSHADQDLTVQRIALQQAGCAIILEEKLSGTRADDRPQLAIVRQILQMGDALVVTRLDRLGRSLRDLANIAHELQTRGAHLRVIEQPVDTSTSAGRAFFGMLSVFAEFEHSIRAERQREGIARAKRNEERRTNGMLKYAGKPPSIDRTRIHALHAAGIGATDIAHQLQIGRASVYRILAEATTPESTPNADA